MATDSPVVAGRTTNGATNAAANPDVAAVAGVAGRIVAAWAQQDGDAFAAVFTEDGTMILPGDVHKRGRDEVRAFMTAAFAGPYRGTQVTGTPLSLRFLTPDVAVMITEGGVLAAGETEVAPERQIRATWVAQRVGGGWQLAAYHNSPSTTPAG